MLQNNTLILSAIATALLASCSGSDNTDPLEGTTTELSCSSQLGGLFFDEVCSPWSPPSVFEQLKSDLNISQEVQLGEAGELVSFNLVETDDPKHNTVLDFRFNANTEYNALPHIKSPTPADMSDFASGYVVFDVKVLDLGASTDGLDFTLSCGYPCQQTDYRLNISSLNTWTTFRIPVERIILDGLDITNVASVFQLLPVWSSQSGAHFQVDNIYWEKGDEPAINKCYSEHYDREDRRYSIRLTETSDNSELNIEPWSPSINTLMNLSPQWQTITDGWALIVHESETDSGTLDSCAYSGTLSASIKLPKEYVQDESLQVAFAFESHDGSITYSPKINASTLPTDEWAKISTPLSNNAHYSNLSGIGLAFFEGDALSEATMSVSWDNIVITH